MNTRKSLAKVFGPVLLLTATLALPVDTALAAPHGRAAAHAQANQHKQKDQKGQKQQQRQAARQQQVAQRQQAIARQQAVQQQNLRRQQVVVQRQQVVRRQTVQRRQVVQPQRIIVRQQPQTRVYQYDSRVYTNGTYYDPRYRTQRGGADRSVVAIDGYLDDGRDCMLLRDHEGRTWAMVGGTYGLEPGEHVRLYGRIVDGGACNWEGTAFDIYEVQTVWADDHHKRTYYDHLYDGPFDQNRQYEDDRYYDDRYNADRDGGWWNRLFGN